MKQIVKRLHPVCSLIDCPRGGKPMNVVVYEDGYYRGGRVWRGLLPDGRDLWECPSCYWSAKNRSRGVINLASTAGRSPTPPFYQSWLWFPYVGWWKMWRPDEREWADG